MGIITANQLAHEVIQRWNRGEIVELKDASGISVFDMIDLELSDDSFISDEQHNQIVYYRMDEDGVPDLNPVFTLLIDAQNSAPPI